MTPTVRVMLCLAALALSHAARADAPIYRVTDIRTGFEEGSSSPTPFCALGSRALFAASADNRAARLWVSDGTGPGTQRATALSGAAGETNPMRLHVGTDPLCVVAGGVAFLPACNELHGCELWRSDGTPAGTWEVDVSPGSFGSDPGVLARVGNRAIFSAWGNGGRLLWSSDGTPAGTVALSSPLASIQGSAGGPSLAFVVAALPNESVTLWRTDGTPAGTVQAMPPDSGIAWTSAWKLTVVSNRLYFMLGSELWRSDGTLTGTHALTTGVTLYSVVGRLPVIGAEIGYSKQVGGSLQFWVLDTSTETSRLVFACTTCEPGAADVRVSGNRWLIPFNRTGGYGEWWSDGTANGTVRLPAFTKLDGSLAPVGPAVAPFLFPHSDGLLWRSNGTAAGTSAVAGSSATSLPPEGNDWANSAVLDIGNLVLGRDDGVQGNEPWLVDATSGGFSMLANLLLLPASSLVQGFSGGASFADRVLFSATNDANEPLVWFSDGSAAGTGPLLAPPIDPRPRGLWILGAAHNGVVLFADTIQSGATLTSRLWRTDGTSAGTQLLRTWPAFGTGVGVGIPRAIYRAGDYWLFPMNIQQTNVWRSDGTSAGTESVSLGVTALTNGFVDEVGNQLLFSAQAAGDGAGNELWRSDGTPAGTYRIKDLVPGPTGSGPGGFVADAPSPVLFSATGESGPELWQTDGTPDGTERLATFPSQLNSYPAQLQGFARTPFAVMALVGNAYGWQLSRVLFGSASAIRSWSTNLGFATNPRMLSIGSSVVFSAWDFSNGQELWVSDGFSAALLRDVAPGTASGFSNSGMFAVIGERLLFEGCSETGCEPWTSDGTSQGTRPVLDLEPGPEDSFPSLFGQLADVALLAANGGSTGFEPWALRVSALSEPVAARGDVDGDGQVDDADRTALEQALGRSIGDVDFPPGADLDGDGEIGTADQALWLAEFGPPPVPVLPYTTEAGS